MKKVLITGAKGQLGYELPRTAPKGYKCILTDKDELDIKKGGIFAIVHGVRTLALEYHISELHTTARIEQLEKSGHLQSELAQELIEAFDFLLSLKLKLKLEDIDNNKDNGNYIQPSKLKLLERNLLKDSFKVVNKFKSLLTSHYSLDLLSR